MNPIYYLKALEPYLHLTNHFVLKINNKFMVFTTHPVNGLKNTLISNINIAGKTQPQYIVENIHIVDLTKMNFKVSELGAKFYLKYFTDLQPMVEKMQLITEKLT